MSNLNVNLNLNFNLNLNLNVKPEHEPQLRSSDVVTTTFTAAKMIRSELS